MLDNDQVEGATEDQDDLDADTLEGGEAEGNDTLAADEPEADGDLVITLDGDDEGEAESEKDFDPKAKAALDAVRASNRNLRKQLSEAKRGAPPEQAAPAQQVLRPRPKQEDHGYDDAAYDADVDKWHEERRVFEQQADAVKTEYRTKLEGFNAAAKALPVRDYEDAKEAVVAGLDIGQQNAIIMYLDKDEAAKVVYALGKSPARLEALSKIKDPVKFGMELAKISTGVKVTNKPKAAPESALKPGGAASAGTRDLESLRASAQKSGDWSAYFAAKRAQAK